MRVSIFFLLILLLSGLSGCATPPPDPCLHEIQIRLSPSSIEPVLDSVRYMRCRAALAR